MGFLFFLCGNFLPMTTTTQGIADQMEFRVGYVRQSGHIRKKTQDSLSFKGSESWVCIYLLMTCYRPIQTPQERGFSYFVVPASGMGVSIFGLINLNDWSDFAFHDWGMTILPPLRRPSAGAGLLSLGRSERFFAAPADAAGAVDRDHRHFLPAPGRRS